jgi:hypothetical protein
MIVASMIETVIMPRFATGARASLLTRRYPFAKKNCRFLMISMADEFQQTTIRRGWSSEIRWLLAAPVSCFCKENTGAALPTRIRRGSRQESRIKSLKSLDFSSKEQRQQDGNRDR